MSSGDAMNIMTQLASQIPGVSVAWAGQSYQERLSSGQAPSCTASLLIVVFLCLAALYESWSIPLVGTPGDPPGLVRRDLRGTLRGMQNDVYLQVGLITTDGPLGEERDPHGGICRTRRAGGQTRDRRGDRSSAHSSAADPHDQFAFIFGVLPLALATGAGANSRAEIGTAVVGGMLTATILAIFYIPFFFVLVRRSVRDGIKAVRERLRRRKGAQA